MCDRGMGECCTLTTKYKVKIIEKEQHQMPLRPILTINLDERESVCVPSAFFACWNAFSAKNLDEARRALEHHFYPVGMVLITSKNPPDIEAVDAFLATKQSTRWVGVFPAELIQLPVYRKLIVDHFFDYHTEPIDLQRLNYSLGHAYGLAELTGNPHAIARLQNDMNLVGHSAPLQALRKNIRKVAQARAPVLIWGESGSGKELTAQAIHTQSSRASGPFIAVNCGAIPASLIQSELFGYERGAFTGAHKEKHGLIESADKGTLFLDEVADLPLEMQANLLRFLQEGTITRVGSTLIIGVDTRVIAASHIHLEAAVKAGKFREDLFYRINVLPLHVPPLRERKEDLELLVQHFFSVFSSDKNPRLKGFSKRAISAIKAHDWPGNVRELINRIRRAMVMSEGRLITPEDLDLAAPHGERQGEALEQVRIRAEREAIHVSLQGRGSNVANAARDLGVSRMTLYRLMEKHGINS